MASLQSEIIIKNEYRPCFIDLKDGRERKALFHKWIMKEDLFKKQYAMGLVELENGKVLEVYYSQIRFIDNKIKEYCFEEGE